MCLISASSSVSSTIAKSFKSIPWPSTTSQLSLHGHQGCSPRLFSKAGVWRRRSSDLACLSLSLCLLYPPSPPAAFSTPEVFFVHYCEVKSQCHFLRKPFLSAPNVCCSTVWKDSTQWHKGGPDHSNLPANTTATDSHYLSNNVDRVLS